MSTFSRLKPIGLAAAVFALLAPTAMAAPVTKIIGHPYAEYLKGSDAPEIIEGRDGHDDIWGRGGDDQISGNDGDDVIYGGTGNDKIYGDGGCTDATNNVDDGTDDECTSTTGSDMITGGPGADTIFGGPGADVYIYNSVADSPAGKGKSDRIYLSPFNDGSSIHPTPVRDFIDLRRVDANGKKAGKQHFTFIGKKAFSGKPGELRVSNTNMLMGDTTGNGKADFAIKLDVLSEKPWTFTGEELLLK